MGPCPSLGHAERDVDFDDRLEPVLHNPGKPPDVCVRPWSACP
jgi:hypothetical protein